MSLGPCSDLLGSAAGSLLRKERTKPPVLCSGSLGLPSLLGKTGILSPPLLGSAPSVEAPWPELGQGPLVLRSGGWFSADSTNLCEWSEN